MTWTDQFPNSMRFGERLNTGNTIELSLLVRSFLLPSGLSLLEKLVLLLLEANYLKTLKLFSVRLTFARALMIRFFPVEWSVRPVMAYFRKPMLATRWIEILLKTIQMRRVEVSK